MEAFSSVNLKDEETATHETDSVMNACRAVPYVGPSDFKTLMIVEAFQKLLKEVWLLNLRHGLFGIKISKIGCYFVFWNNLFIFLQIGAS